MKLLLLGTGYVGSFFLSLYKEKIECVASVHQKQCSEDIPTISFNIQNSDTWVHIPSDSETMVYTIPPQFQDEEKEFKLLHIFSLWLKMHRPNLNQIIYISTTGVYSETEGTYSENSKPNPSHLRGRLRLLTEQLFSTHFNTTVLRAGGIYGPNRHLLNYLQKTRKLPPQTFKTHRIHVEDLCGIIYTILQNSCFPNLFNAVDVHPSSFKEMIEWYQKNTAEHLPEFTFGQVSSHRKITNTAIRKTLGYRLKYPSFNEGLAQIYLTDSPITHLTNQKNQ